MAQPPDITETFVREVDENLRRDRLQDFVKEKGGWIVAAVILFLAASGGFIWYQQHKVKVAETHVEQLAQIYKDIGTGNTAKVPAQLDDLSNSSSKAVRATALFTRAAFALQQNDQKLALATYKKLADDSSLPDAYRNAALIRQTAVEFDKLQPQQVIARLEPLAKPGNPWFGIGRRNDGAGADQARQEQGSRAAVRRPSPRTRTRRARSATGRSRSPEASASMSVAPLGPQAQ